MGDRCCTCYQTAPIGKISAGIDFPIPMESIEKLANKLISDLLKDKLDKIFSSKPLLELDWKKLTPIVGPSSDKISENANKERNFVSFLHFECHFLWEEKFQVYHFMIQFSPITIYLLILGTEHLSCECKLCGT